jgi:tetratricopeptide (TPR) repeat protein
MRLIGAMAAIAALAPTSLATTPTLLGIGYICAAERRPATEAPRRIVMTGGMGSGGLIASAGTPEAQSWLTYGIKLYHAFYHDDAKAAFAKAVELDPNCALCAWGQALGLGPTLNYTVPDEQTAKALVVAKRAAVLARTPLERDLAAALEKRYATDLTPVDRERRYGQEMAGIAERHPEEPDLENLAAHALLTPQRGNDVPGLTAGLALLEKRLAKAPDDSAAIHYYIHATEFAGRPADALPYARRLGALSPNASHLVHMAAHTLVHVGQYEEVAVVNAEAIKVDAEISQAMAYGGPLGAAQYYAHNLSFGFYGALMAGDRDLALKYAAHAPLAFPVGSDPTRRTFAVSRTLVAYGRYEPKKALALPAPAASDQPMNHIYWRYARGEALAAAGDARGVLKESKAIEALKVENSGGLPEIKLIAAKVLAGRAAMLRGKPKKAIALYAEAAAVQEKTFAKSYDPPPWWYPVRRSMAAAKLKARDYAGAAADARVSLTGSPRDGLALQVLSDAEAKMGDRTGAEQHRTEARADFLADVNAVSLDLI